MQTHFRHKRKATSIPIGVVVSTAAQRSFKPHSEGSNPSDPTTTIRMKTHPRV